jgi:hypothetical protein
MPIHFYIRRKKMKKREFVTEIKIRAIIEEA